MVGRADCPAHGSAEARTVALGVLLGPPVQLSMPLLERACTWVSPAASAPRDLGPSAPCALHPGASAHHTTRPFTVGSRVVWPLPSLRARQPPAPGAHVPAPGHHASPSAVAPPCFIETLCEFLSFPVQLSVSSGARALCDSSVNRRPGTSVGLPGGACDPPEGGLAPGLHQPGPDSHTCVCCGETLLPSTPTPVSSLRPSQKSSGGLFARLIPCGIVWTQQHQQLQAKIDPGAQSISAFRPSLSQLQAFPGVSGLASRHLLAWSLGTQYSNPSPVQL